MKISICMPCVFCTFYHWFLIARVISSASLHESLGNMIALALRFSIACYDIFLNFYSVFQRCIYFGTIFNCYCWLLIKKRNHLLKFSVSLFQTVNFYEMLLYKFIVKPHVYIFFIQATCLIIFSFFFFAGCWLYLVN